MFSEIFNINETAAPMANILKGVLSALYLVIPATATNKSKISYKYVIINTDVLFNVL